MLIDSHCHLSYAGLIEDVDAVGLPGDQIDDTRRRRTKRRSIGVVAHGKELRIIPLRGHGVAVKIAHHFVTARAGVQRKQIHQAGIKCQLLRGIVVILIGGDGSRAVNPKWTRGPGAVGWIEIGIEIQQGTAKTVHRRRVGRRLKLWFAHRIGRDRIGSEIVVEGNVFLENHYQVLNGCRRGRRRFPSLLCSRFGGTKSRDGGRSQCRGQRKQKSHRFSGSFGFQRLYHHVLLGPAQASVLKNSGCLAVEFHTAPKRGGG